MSWDRFIDKQVERHRHLVCLSEWRDPTPEQEQILQWLKQATLIQIRECRIYQGSLYWPVTTNQRVHRLIVNTPEHTRHLSKTWAIRFQAK